MELNVQSLVCSTIGELRVSVIGEIMSVGIDDFGGNLMVKGMEYIYVLG